MTRPWEDPTGGEHAEWDALAVGWALSALEPEDEARVRAHLPTCSRCSETVGDAVRTVTDLAYAVPDESPPRRLKRQILEEAGAAPRGAVPPPAVVGGADGMDGSAAGEWPASAPVLDDDGQQRAARPELGPVGTGPVGTGPVGTGPVGAGPTEQATGGEVVPLAPRRRWLTRTAVAAGVALLAALGAWNVQLRSEQDELRRFVAERDALVARLTEPGEADIALIKAVGNGERAATVVVKDGRVSLITETLPRRPGEETYWLWSVPDAGDPVPLAGLNVPETKLSACNIELPAGVETRAFAISAEPGPDRPARPSRIIGQGETETGA